jgi:hypothetical protein
MGFTSRDYYERAAAAEEQAIRAADLYNRFIWLDIAHLWCFLAEYALRAEGEKLCSPRSDNFTVQEAARKVPPLK